MRASPLAAAAALPLAGAIDWSIPSELLSNPLVGAPEEDFGCTSEHNPVVLLHGLSANREVGLNALAHHMTDLGFCTYSITYGAHTLAPWIGGLRSMRDVAGEIADYIRTVKDRTGADKVDLVGHSEGGVMALYVPLTQDGIADMVEHNVALGPAVHGAQYFGFTDLFYLGGDVTRKLVQLAFDTLGCPACDDMAPDGEVYNDFKAASEGAGIVQPGNKATVIVSNGDKLVEAQYSRVDEDGVRNLVVQDFCPDDAVGHAGLARDEGIWDIVVNELTEDYEGSVGCVQGLPF